MLTPKNKTNPEVRLGWQYFRQYFRNYSASSSQHIRRKVIAVTMSIKEISQRETMADWGASCASDFPSEFQSEVLGCRREKTSRGLPDSRSEKLLRRINLYLSKCNYTAAALFHVAPWHTTPNCLHNKMYVLLNIFYLISLQSKQDGECSLSTLISLLFGHSCSHKERI